MPDHFTDEEVEALKAGLEGVTPGPWTWGMKYVSNNPESMVYDQLFSTPDGRTAVEGSRWEKNAAYVALLSPDAIRRLLARLEQAEARVGELTRALERQGDNMAFIINHVGLATWHDKFKRELDEDMVALQAAGPPPLKWVIWTYERGAVPPLVDGTPVMVRLRNGREHRYGVGSMAWNGALHDRDIIAYAVIEGGQ